MNAGMPSRRRLLLGLLAGGALAATPLQAQEVTKILVGFPPGATSDTLTRLIAEQIGKRLRQTVIVENKAGAGGRLANEAVKAAAPDGTTLLMTPVATMSIYPHSYAGQLRYDPFADFAPVAHLANFQIGFAVGAQVPATTLAEYVAWVKKDPAKNGFYASAASGSIPHFFGVMFARAAGIALTHVAYKGTGPAMQALAAGEIPAVSTVTADIKPLVAAGKARLLAVGGERPDPNFPAVPTFRELGFDLVAQPWYGLFAPAGTPAAVIDKLADAVAQALAEPAFNRRLAELGLEPTGYGPRRLGQIMKADYERWGPVIRASGYKPE